MPSRQGVSATMSVPFRHGWLRRLLYFMKLFYLFQFLITGFFFFVDQIFQNVNHLEKISNTVWQYFDPRYSPPPLFCLKNWTEFVGIPLALYEKKILQTVLDPFPHCVTNTFFILTELKKYKKEQKAFFSVYFCILGPTNLCSVPSYTLSSYCTLSMRSGYFRN